MHSSSTDRDLQPPFLRSTKETGKNENEGIEDQWKKQSGTTKRSALIKNFIVMDLNNYKVDDKKLWKHGKVNYKSDPL